MAYTRDVAGKHRKHKRQTSYSDAGDWEPPRDASRHSLPYQAQQHSEVQRPVGRKSKHSTSQRTKQPVDVPVSRAMPPSRMLTRSGPVKSRNRRVYDEDEEDERDRKERLRGRMQSRSRSRVKIRARSPSSESSAGSFIATPTRSSYVHHRSAHPSAPPSAPSPGSDSESSSGETDSSDSTEDYGNRPPTLKERMNGKSTAPGTPDSASVRNPASRSQSRHRRRNEVVLEVETISDSSEDDAPPLPRVVVKGSAMAQRHKHQSRASSAAPPRQQSRHRGRHRETHTSYSPKRSQNRYFYYSDVPYTEKPPFSRSRATSSSPVTFHSLSSSAARRSATFPGNNFFEAPDYPIHHSKSYKLNSCKQCAYDVSSSESVRLGCGHYWCISCLKKRFKRSIKDAQAMPPTCCSPDCVPTEHVNHLFKDDFKRTWNQKYAEASMRKQNQCPSRKCRAPIRPEDIRHHNNGRTSAVCRKCNTEICGICYKKRHESKKCPVDVNDEPGWKKCQKCHASVQLKDGCTHMTCPCGAEFCTVCGVKRKACKCPWFTYDEDSDESEDFDHVEVPAPVPMSMPPMGRGHPGGMDSLPRTLRPEPSFGFGGSRRPPRPDERAMRLPHPDDDYDDDEDEEDGYLQDFGDMGLGSPPPLFRPDDFRRSHSTLVPPAPTPPVPVPAPSVAPERANASANYVSGVNKARGVKGSSSMERLAGRFSDQRHGPQRSFGQPMSPPPMHPASAYGHPMPFQPPIAPISRRHTMDDDMYDMVFSPPFPGPFPRAAGPYDYMDDSALHAPSRRRRYRDPRPSELAGLTGPGSGMNRVAEWMDHVDENPFDAQTVT